MAIKVLNEFLPEAEQIRLGGIKVGESLSIENGVLNTNHEYSAGWTNVITQIPQTVSLELSGGTVTLAAGSKAYIPDGFEVDGVTPKFIEYSVTTNLSNDTTGAGTLYLCILYDGGSLYAGYAGITVSVTSWPTSPTVHNIYYNRVENLCRAYFDGAWHTVSLPLAIGVRSASGWESIEQVFNGAGYVCNSVFTLPGIKGLIPNGRNADGTPRVYELNTLRCFIYNFPDISVAIERNLCITNNGITISLHTITFNVQDNYNYEHGNIYPGIKTNCRAFYGVNGVMSVFKPLTIATVDFNTGKCPIETVDIDTRSYINGNLGVAFNYSNNTPGKYITFDCYKSNNGVFTISGHNNGLYVTYTADSLIEANTNSVTYKATLMDESGIAHFPGDVHAIGQFSSGTADLAEKYVSDKKYSIGTLVEFGGEKEITLAKKKVNGVISEKPGFLLNSESKGQPIALIGKTKVRVVGIVDKGDKLMLYKDGVAKVKRWYNFFKKTIGVTLESNMKSEEKLVMSVVQLVI